MNTNDRERIEDLERKLEELRERIDRQDRERAAERASWVRIGVDTPETTVTEPR